MCAPADLVEQDEAARGRVAQDVGRLLHLHHEGRLPAQDLVGGPHPGEDPVRDPDLGFASGHEAAHLGHEHDEGGLAEEGRLAAHVGAGENVQSRDPRAHGEVVGHEGFCEQTFHDRVAALDVT